MIHTIKDGMKKILEDGFGQIYIRPKKNMSSDVIEVEEEKSVDLDLFKIPKTINPIYKRINSKDDLFNIKEEIKDKYKKVINDFFIFLEKAEDQIDDEVVSSLEIIGKTLQNRNRKLDSALKRFNVEDSWSIERIQSEFVKTLQKSLKDILASTMPAISTGIKTDYDVYEKVVVILNTFYTELGIYTKEFNVGDNIADETQYIELIEMKNDEIQDKSFKDTISHVESSAYVFEEEFIILEAKVSVWKVS